MPGNSVTILSSQVHAGDSTVQTVTSDKVQGDGYYGRSDGFHTVQINLTDFSGDITLEGSLALTPTDEDWFTIELSSTSTVAGTVDTTGAVSTGSTVTVSSLSYADETSNNNFNFVGNFVWIRAQVADWTNGSIGSILMNH